MEINQHPIHKDKKDYSIGHYNPKGEWIHFVYAHGGKNAGKELSYLNGGNNIPTSALIVWFVCGFLLGVFVVILPKIL